MKAAWNRRQALFAGAGMALAPWRAFGRQQDMISRPIPRGSESLPVIGLGTYRVFDVSGTPAEIAARKAIVDMLTERGGSVIDTSPMYNRAETVIGDVIAAGSSRPTLFIATKVWTDGRENGIEQMARSAALMNTEVIDLMQVHNLRDTDVHMRTIRQWQDKGRIRYNGLTHYTAGAHAALDAAMRRHKPEFIQVNYSIGEPEAEDRLLPLAQELGIAVIVNRPFTGGRLFAAVRGRPLPEWASEFAASWGQFFLKYIVSHPAVSCVIPGTSRLQHMADNLDAGFGALPDPSVRRRMLEYVKDL